MLYIRICALFFKCACGTFYKFLTMVKKYYCDYCNRSFNDDRGTRMKHNNSIQHIRMKKEHFDAFRDSKEIFQDESTKKKCRKYFQDGCCAFGNQCTFTHYSDEDLNLLKMEIERSKKMNSSVSLANVSLSSWLSQWTPSEGRKETVKITRNVSLESHILPEEARHHFDLPPSVLPFNIKDFIDIPVENWGE